MVGWVGVVYGGGCGEVIERREREEDRGRRTSGFRDCGAIVTQKE